MNSGKALRTAEYMNVLMNPPTLPSRAQLTLNDRQQESSNSDQVVDSPEDNTLYDWLNDSDEANRDASGESSAFEEFVVDPELSQLPSEIFEIGAEYYQSTF